MDLKTLYHYQTRFGKYGIALQEYSDGYLRIAEFKNGSIQGIAFLGSTDLDKAHAELTKRIDEAAKYDSIFYT